MGQAVVRDLRPVQAKPLQLVQFRQHCGALVRDLCIPQAKRTQRLELGEVRQATLVVHRPESRYVPSDAVHYVVENLPHAIEVEVEGDARWPFLGDVDAVVGEIAEFLVGERNLLLPERRLAAVLFTDLVGSTQRAAALGDATWKEVLDRHDAAARRVVGRCNGRVVKTTGDGVLALFPSADGALRAARRGSTRRTGCRT